MLICRISQGCCPGFPASEHKAVFVFPTNSHHPLCLCTYCIKFFASAVVMSNFHPAATANSSINFQIILNNALKAYEKRTKMDLLAHPLAVELEDCNSPAAILAILHRQAQELDPSPSRDDRWTKWLNPTVNILHTLSRSLGETVRPSSATANVARGPELFQHSFFAVI